MKTNSNNRPLFYLTIFFLFALLFVFNIKSFILVVLTFGLLLFLLTDFGLVEVLFILLLFSLPFEKGLRGWSVQVVPPGPELWIPGYKFYFGFALKYIFAAALFLLTIFNKKKVFKQFSLSHWLITGFLVLSTISTFLASDFNLAFLGLIRVFSIVWIYFAARQLFRNKKIQKYFQKLVLAFLLFFGFIGIGQFISQQPLGLFLEDSTAFRAFGYTTTEGDFLYRVSGLTGHPTFFASFLSLLLPVGLGFSFSFIEKRKFKNLYFIISVIAALFGLIAVFGTFSRSAWIALGVSILFFVWKIYKKKKKSVFKLLVPIGLPVLLVLLFFSPLFISRLVSFKHIWTLGSGRVRLDLIGQSWQMIKAFPLFGVGLNHFTRIMNLQDLPPELKGFMYPVHNTFLLFLTETGVLAGLVFILFVVRNLYRTFGKSFRNWINFGLWIGAFTFLINGQFHTLFNQDPSLDLFIVFLAYLSLL